MTSPFVIRVRFLVLADHVHCRVFTAPDPGQTFALAGTLVFTTDEWPHVQDAWRGAIDFQPEEETRK